MTRCHKVEHAQKDYPNNGIKKGDTYYWWAFRHGGKYFSLTPPKPSQLTQSEFLGSIYGIQETIESLTTEDDDIQSQIDDIVSELETLRDEQEEKKSNMPDSLQESPTAELLQERYDNLDTMINGFNDINTDDWEEPDDEDVKEDLGDKDDEETQEAYDERIAERKEEMKQERRDAILEEIQGISYEGS